jgi:hypothetical protein
MRFQHNENCFSAASGVVVEDLWKKFTHIACVKQWCHSGRHFIYYISNAPEFVTGFLSG